MEQQALRTELNLSVSGGGKANQYFFSAGYLNDKGIALESGYHSFNLRSNVTSEMTSWLKGSINLSFAIPCRIIRFLLDSNKQRDYGRTYYARILSYL